MLPTDKLTNNALPPLAEVKKNRINGKTIIATET